MAIDKCDVELLGIAINRCSAERLPVEYLQQGVRLKQELENALAQLQHALELQDLARIETCVLECQQTGMPARYLEGAIDRQQHLHGLLKNLAHACEARDVEALEMALQDTQPSERTASVFDQSKA